MNIEHAEAGGDSGNDLVITKNRVGRPRVILDPAKVEELSGLGMTGSQIADRLGIARATLYAVISRDEEIADAMRRGLAKSVEEAQRTLYDMAIRERNTTALIFWLKCRGGMNMKSEVELSVKPGIEPARGAEILADLDARLERFSRISALPGIDDDAIDAEFAEAAEGPSPEEVARMME